MEDYSDLQNRAQLLLENISILERQEYRRQTKRDVMDRKLDTIERVLNTPGKL